MATERMVEKLDSVFDLRIHKALNLPESVSTRVRLTYSKPENRTTFKVLSAKTTEETRQRIAAWLDDHIDVDDIVGHLGTEEIDMDTLPKPCNA